MGTASKNVRLLLLIVLSSLAWRTSHSMKENNESNRMEVQEVFYALPEVVDATSTKSISLRAGHLVLGFQETSGESADDDDRDSQPQSWRDLAKNNVTNVHDFVKLLTSRDGQPVDEEELFQRSENDEGKIVIAGSGLEVAVSDECSPRKSTVKLGMVEAVQLQDPNVVFYPESTLIERCGGYTATPNLACVPVRRDYVVLSVLKAHYLYPGATKLKMEGFYPVRVERHLSCRSTCMTRLKDCGENSRCTLKQNVMGNPKASQAEVEAQIASRRNSRPGLFLVTNPKASNTTPTTPPTTTPTTTAPSGTTQDCSHLFCPRHMVRGMSPSGRCLCQRR